MSSRETERNQEATVYLVSSLYTSKEARGDGDVELTGSPMLVQTDHHLSGQSGRALHGCFDMGAYAAGWPNL